MKQHFLTTSEHGRKTRFLLNLTASSEQSVVVEEGWCNRHSGKMTAHAQGRLRDFRARRNGRHNISIETNRVKMAAI